MKQILLSIALLSSCTISFSSQPPAEKKYNCVTPQRLGGKLAQLVTYDTGLALHSDAPSYAFENKQDAIKAGWQFKKQPFGRAELVIRPIAGKSCVSDGKNLQVVATIKYVYALSLGMQGEKVLIQSMQRPKPFFETQAQAVALEADEIGKFPENDSE